MEALSGRSRGQGDASIGRDGWRGGPRGAPPPPSPAASPLVQQARLIGGDHVLDVDEGVFATVALEGLQRLLDQVADILPLLLAVVDAVPGVHWFMQTHREPRYCVALSRKVLCMGLGVGLQGLCHEPQTFNV